MKLLNLLTLLTADEPDIKPAIQPLAADANPVAARRGQMLLDLVSFLEVRGPTPAAFAYLQGTELWLSPMTPHNRTRVHIAVVWRDYGPIREGFPEMYYRLSIKRTGVPLSREERSSDLAEVERAICKGFGWVSRATIDHD